MRIVVQRVKNAKLTCGDYVSQIGLGLVVYVGFGVEDEDKSLLDKLAEKITKLRIFSDENGKMNLSIKDVGGEILCVSQFTLYGDPNNGNRPSFSRAKNPILANEYYQYFAKRISEIVPCKLGVFGGDMQIEQVNDGPVTILYGV